MKKEVEDVMKFFQLDPRPQGTENNEAIFTEAASLGIPVIGIEVTLPAYAGRCLMNFDHHGPEDTAETPSACEQVYEFVQKNWTNIADFKDAFFITVRPDADSVMAMGVVYAALNYGSVEPSFLRDVGVFDRLGPSAGRPSDEVRALARKASDFQTSLEERVKWAAGFMSGGPANWQEEIPLICKEADEELEAARAASKVSLFSQGKITLVESSHRFATNLGYESAPVVVAFNPEFPVDPRDPSLGTYRKFTVCRYNSHVKCDLPAALKEFQSLEKDWGGRGDIFGSPQRVSSELSIEKVLEIVAKHLH